MNHLLNTDPETERIISSEVGRLRNGLELIPSENLVSVAVLQAIGSVLNNKYSEGFPGKRYYGGNDFSDMVESLAIERAKKLFGTEHANVQPYSGSPANHAAIFSVAKPGDAIMGMNLLFGGHLTHGWKVSFSAHYYRSIQYKTDENGIIDYDEIERLAKKERPRLIFCGATSYPRVYDFKRLGEIAHETDAFFIADIAHEAGLIAGKAYPSPVGHADIITMTTHKTLRGPRGGIILCNGNPSNPLSPLPDGADIRENLPTLVDRAVFPGLQGGPHNHITAGIAVALKEASASEFQVYAKQILKNARVLSETLMENGLKLTTGGTENHLMIVDLSSSGMKGKEAETALDEAGITVNKQVVPFDERKPWEPSGIRIGTPAITTRGMKESEMKHIGELISRVINNPGSSDIKRRVREQVLDLCSQFPIYPDIKSGYIRGE